MSSTMGGFTSAA